MADYTVTEKTGTAIQAAVDAAHNAGGGRVCLEPGVYLSGTICLKSNVELHLPAGAEIKGYSNPEQYDDFRDPGFDNVSPEGTVNGKLDTQKAPVTVKIGDGSETPLNSDGTFQLQPGQTAAVPAGATFAKPPHPRPRMVQFFDCRNVLFEGVSFVDSPGWTFWLLGCDDVHVSRIRVTGCQQMINNDGIDIDDCRRVTVSDSFFRTGDDCIILRAIRRSPDHHAVCEDVTITNCTLDSWCQGIRIGCPSDDTIRRCTFSNITFKGRGNGININNLVRYLRKGCTGYLDLRDLTFTNFVIESERVPLWINVEDSIRLRYIGAMTFSNFRIRAKQPIRLEGSPETWIDDLRFSEIVSETEDTQAIVANRVSRISMNQVEVRSTQKSG